LHAEKQGWTIVDSYSDRAVSGASLLRPGIQELIRDAMNGRFVVVLAEAMDRLSRDQEDIAGLFKRMAFAGVRIVTLSEGDVTHLHVGLKGTMNALFLKDLADKTRRGLRGRVENGKSGGGLCFGYDVVKQFAPDGEPIRGDRTINAAEAAIVRRIFCDYLAGKSSRTIAWELNKEGVPGPQGSEWGPSTIHGNPKRGVGILNNELYIGRLVWNRLRYLKDPDTGRRVSRLNPESEWIVQEVPELRIVDQDTWDDVKTLQRRLAIEAPAPGENALNGRRRPKHLFGGLVKCGCCGGGYIQISKDLLGCATARNKGTCDNRVNIRLDALEASVLNGLRNHLMDPGVFKDFCEEFTKEVNRARIDQISEIEGRRKELEKVDRDLDRAVQAIIEGVPGSRLKDKIAGLEARKAELSDFLKTAVEPPPLLHPSMAETFRKRMAELHERLGVEESRADAVDVLRRLVNRVMLIPNGKDLEIVLRGELAAILSFAAGRKKSDLESASRLAEDLVSPGSLAAGPGRARSLRQGTQSAKGDPFGSPSAISQGSVVAGTRNTRSLRNDPENAKGAPSGTPSAVSQVSVVAGVGFEPTTFRL
jgi:DNA invertase Pin-like site-specific DNA recombinase